MPASGSRSAHRWRSAAPRAPTPRLTRSHRSGSWAFASELFQGTVGGAGDEWDYERRQIGFDVQWRFWGYRGLLRPWVGAGMSWGSIQSVHLEETYPAIDAHFWEYLRLSVGLDVVAFTNFALGPWFRYGWGTTKGPYSKGTSLEPLAYGLRLTVAFP